MFCTAGELQVNKNTLQSGHHSQCVQKKLGWGGNTELMKKIPVPRLFNYQKLMKRVNQIYIGDLNDVREILCHGLSKEDKVNDKFRNLLPLLLKMAHFYLFVNKYRKDKLDWRRRFIQSCYWRRWGTIWEG